MRTDGGDSMEPVFQDDEIIYLNSIMQGRKSLEKEKVLSQIAFAREAAPQEEEILSLIDRTYIKLKNMDAGQWKTMAVSFPLPVSVLADA